MLQSTESSTFREIVAIHATWTDTTVCVQFQALVVKHYADNKGVVAILGNGSKIPKLQDMIRDIFLSLRSYSIVIVPVCISTECHWFSIFLTFRF